MTIHHQILPCSHPNADKLTLIHGWAAENAVWLEWASDYLQPHFEVHLIELPGFGQSDPLPDSERLADAWTEALTDSLPESSHLLGWSLGGLMAQKIALTTPEKVQSLICLASTPRFTQQDHWPYAVSPSLLKDFIKALGIEYGSVVKQFWRLQLQGSENARPLMKKLTEHMSQRSLPSLKGLTQGLHLLKDLDLRSEIDQLKPPTLWLLGEHDPLVPPALCESISKLQTTNDECQILIGAAHMPFFSHPAPTAQAVIEFIERNAHAKI